MQTETAIFAGGCFWCMVKPFDTYPGIKKVISGYTGGHTVDPTYEEVKTQTTGHTEAVLIEFDPSVVSYEQLVEIYWNQTDPTDALGQFQDRGDSYRPLSSSKTPPNVRSLKDHGQLWQTVGALTNRS